MVVIELSVRVKEFVSWALHIPRIIVVDRVIPKVTKLFESSRGTVHDYVVREINPRGIRGVGVDTKSRSDRTCDSVVDVWPSVGEVRNAFIAIVARVRGSWRR